MSNRRRFITLLGGAAAAPSVLWPGAARAQQPVLPVIGYLYPGAPEPIAHLVAAFRQGLSETGFIEGRNVAIEYRWAYNEFDQLAELAGDLVRRRVAVIVTPGSTTAAVVAKAATSTIPIVFSGGGDSVQSGLVASLNRPGGNVTGISSMNVELSAKRLGLLHELVPGAALFAGLVNPKNPTIAAPFVAEVQTAAAAIGRQIEILAASTNGEIDVAFANIVKLRVDALLISPDALFTNRRVQLLTLAARHALPVIYHRREFAEAGGLMSYGSNFADQFRLTGIYTARILKGDKPADLPVLQPTKFELVINLQTAKSLGINMPPMLLARADEVIE